MKKIPTIFKRGDDGIVEGEINPACQWVFDGEGVPRRKYDGACCMVKDHTLYKRRQVKMGHKAPDDFIECDYDQFTGKRWGWVPCRNGAPEDRYFFEAWCDQDDGTYELCGPKVQGNAEQYASHVMIKHDEAWVYEHAPRDYEGLRQFFVKNEFEGLVFHHPDGRMAKIKRKDFLGALWRVTI